MILYKLKTLIAYTLGLFKLFIYKLFYNKQFIIKGIQKVCIDTHITIINNGFIELGNIKCQNNCHISSVGGKLHFGNNVCLNRNNIFICQNNIYIDDNCWFGPNVMIYDHDHIFNKNGIKDDYKLGSVVIEKNCWIGAGCIILRDTHIGEGSVIGAGCVVKGNIPPHSLVTSNRELNIVPIK